MSFILRDCSWWLLFTADFRMNIAGVMHICKLVIFILKSDCEAVTSSSLAILPPQERESRRSRLVSEKIFYGIILKMNMSTHWLCKNRGCGQMMFFFVKICVLPQLAKIQTVGYTKFVAEQMFKSFHLYWDCKMEICHSTCNKLFEYLHCVWRLQNTTVVHSLHAGVERIMYAKST